MIKEVKGDILLSKAAAIAHSIAPMDHFESGLAMSLRKDYPSMYKDFRHYCQTRSPKTGTIWTWMGADRKRIVNMLTQEPSDHGQGHPGTASLSDIRHALKGLAKWIEHEKIESIAIPKIATGVGGQKWENVKPLIEEYLGKLDIPVYVYATYTPDVAAKEG